MKRAAQTDSESHRVRTGCCRGSTLLQRLSEAERWVLSSCPLLPSLSHRAGLLTDCALDRDPEGASELRDSLLALSEGISSRPDEGEASHPGPRLKASL